MPSCCSGVTMEIVPPHMHWHVDVTSTQGRPPIWADTEPAVHGAPVAGMHGWGVSTPSAAAVAVDTCGLPGLMHMPKVGMLVSGMVSAIVATGAVADTIGVARMRLAGVVPMVQVIEVPEVAKGGMQ